MEVHGPCSKTKKSRHPDLGVKTEVWMAALPSHRALMIHLRSIAAIEF
jgi:hypothetical protein